MCLLSLIPHFILQANPGLGLDWDNTAVIKLLQHNSLHLVSPMSWKNLKIEPAVEVLNPIGFGGRKIQV